MKNLILEHIKKHSLKVQSVYTEAGKKVSVDKMEDGNEYFLNINQTRTELGRDSFKKAMGYEAQPQENDAPAAPKALTKTEQKDNLEKFAMEAVNVDIAKNKSLEVLKEEVVDLLRAKDINEVEALFMVDEACKGI